MEAEPAANGEHDVLDEIDVLHQWHGHRAEEKKARQDRQENPAGDPPVGFAGPDSYEEEEVRWSSSEALLLLFTDGLSDMLASSTRGDGEGLILETVARLRYRKVTEEIFSRLASNRVMASWMHR